MSAKSAKWLTGVGAVAMAVGMLALPSAQTATSLGSVQLPRAVMADGQSLAAGTYTLRLSEADVSPVVGQPEDAAQWVEFLRNGEVQGRELATRIAAADVAEVAKTTPPAAGTAKVELLKGGEYLRVWINQAGTHYLLHLSTATG